ncbi:dolichyl-phosphate beta-glucosyltransferase [Phlyctochytrium bullatum]|nr:dolichyl-phosphate beta-glucosyltransferase [Phlyctochytrium bullatum]
MLQALAAAVGIVGVVGIAVLLAIAVMAPVPRPPTDNERHFSDVLTGERRPFPNLLQDDASSSSSSPASKSKDDKDADGLRKRNVQANGAASHVSASGASVSLTVVVPAYNEAKRLPAMMTEALDFLTERRKKDPSKTFEIIVVDDGSKDETSEVARKLAKERKCGDVRVLTLEKNRGKGGAVTQGVLASRGEVILFADADGSTKFSDIERLETALKDVSKSGEAVAVGSRAHMVKSDAVVKRSAIRNFLMYSFHTVLLILGIASIKDTQCGFKLFSRQAAKRIFANVHVEGWIFDIELLLLASWQNIPMVEVPVNWHEIEGSKILDIGRVALRGLLALLTCAGIAQAIVTGGAVTGINLRGRKWNYSPVTEAEFATGDFIHIKGECSDDESFLQVRTNFTVEYWYTFEPEEMWTSSNVPHAFAMGPEYNFWMLFLIMGANGEPLWAVNWLTPCGWLTVNTDPTTNPYFWRSPSGSNYIIQRTRVWQHFAVVSQNFTVTGYLNGFVVGSLYCAEPFTHPPVWTIGIRDWATDTKMKNQLSPIFPFSGEVAEFRAWTRGLSLTELRSRMNRALNAAEIQDRSLMFYFDFNNIQNGYIINDLSPTKRLKGYLGGALGLEVNRPLLLPSAAPVVNISATVLNVTMKESGHYPSTVTIPVIALDDRTSSFSRLAAASGVSFSVTSLPDPTVLTLSALRPGSLQPSTLSGAGPLVLGDNFTLYATHRANAAVAQWAPQRFSVSATLAGETVSVSVVVTILKNSPPRTGDTGGALAPGTVPASWTQNPLTIPSFAWRRAQDNWPVTWEFWTVGAEDDRTFNVPEINDAALGRFNVEVNKNMVMDYGFDPAGSGRTAVPFRQKYGLWNHVAMVSTGKGGTQSMYINGELVATAPGNIAMRPNDKKVLPFNATGFMTSPMTGNAVVDEVRIWNVVRTQAEIQSTMYQRLKGNERGLYMYHNFDSYRVAPDGAFIFSDLGPNGFDVVCRGYTPGAPCPLVRSNVPIGGMVQDLSFADGSNVTFWNPLGLDPDDDPAYLRFVVDTLPADAKLFADKNVTLRSLDGDLRNGVGSPTYTTPVQVGSFIRKLQMNPAVQVVPSADGGGNPYDSFSYHVTDGLWNSEVVTIQISRKCWPGTYLDQSKRKCIPCQPGYYSMGYGFNTQCEPCPAGTSQPVAGSSFCVPCRKAMFISFAMNVTLPTSNTSSTNDSAVRINEAAYALVQLPAFVTGLEDVASFGSYQEAAGQAQCLPCRGLSYALRANATKCDGKATIPKFVSIAGGSSSSSGIGYPPVSGMSPSYNTPSNLRSVLLPESRTADVDQAIENARIVDRARGIVVASVVIAALTLMGLIGTFLFIKDPVIKASSPIALTITAFGIVVGVLSTIAYSVEPTKRSCLAEIWMLPVSFSIVIGMLISKTFRILRIFNNPRAAVIRMTNWDLFGYMIAATAPNIAVLVIWSVFDPPTPVVISRGDGEGLSFVYCNSKSAMAQAGFTAVLYLYNAAILVLLAVLAWMTRTVNALFSESKFIGVFVATTVFVVSLFIPILYFLTNEVTAMYVIKSVAILIVSGVAFASLIGIKFYSIFRNRQMQASGVKTTDSAKNSMMAPLMSGNEKGKHTLNSQYMQLFSNTPGTLVADCVYPVKRMGVVFWNSKIAVLQPETRLLYILSPEGSNAAAAKGQPLMPQTIIFPLTKFTIKSGGEGIGNFSTIQSGHRSSISHQTNSTSNSTGEGTQSGGADGLGGAPIITIVNNESGHVVTLQFENTNIKREWSQVLTKLEKTAPGQGSILRSNAARPSIVSIKEGP